MEIGTKVIVSSSYIFVNTFKYILSTIICCCTYFGYGQQVGKSAIHADAFGAGWYLTVKFIPAFSYEYFLVSKGQHSVMLNAGLGVVKWKDFNTQFNPDILLPFSIAYMYGNMRSHPFVSIGLIYSNYTYFNTKDIRLNRHQQLSLSWSAGYRYTHPVGITGSIYYQGIADGFDIIRHGGGLSIGYRLKKRK